MNVSSKKMAAVESPKLFSNVMTMRNLFSSVAKNTNLTLSEKFEGPSLKKFLHLPLKLTRIFLAESERKKLLKGNIILLMLFYRARASVYPVYQYSCMVLLLIKIARQIYWLCYVSHRLYLCLRKRGSVEAFAITNATTNAKRYVGHLIEFNHHF